MNTTTAKKASSEVLIARLEGIWAQLKPMSPVEYANAVELREAFEAISFELNERNPL